MTMEMPEGVGGIVWPRILPTLRETHGPAYPLFLTEYQQIVLVTWPISAEFSGDGSTTCISIVFIRLVQSGFETGIIFINIMISVLVL